MLLSASLIFNFTVNLSLLGLIRKHIQKLLAFAGEDFMLQEGRKQKAELHSLKKIETLEHTMEIIQLNEKQLMVCSIPMKLL